MKMFEHKDVAKVVKRDLNRFIDSLPFELHIPFYNYCGPVTKLEKRLKNKDAGVNSLDEACKSHDLLYSTSKDPKVRAEADKELAKSAIRRFMDPRVASGEGTAAAITALSMAYKTNPYGGVIPDKNLLKMISDVIAGEYALDELKRLDPENIKNNMERYEAHKRKMKIEGSKLKSENLSNDDAIDLDIINKSIAGPSLPHYNYCGSGDVLPTNLSEKLANNVKGINKLDEACKSHAIVYKHIEDPTERAKADIQLAKDAARIILGDKCSEKERHDAVLVGVAAAYKVVPPSKPYESFTDTDTEVGRGIHSLKQIVKGLKAGEEQLRKF